MLETIVKLLNEAKVTAWELNQVKTEGWEFYFIRHALDQNRRKEVEHLTVKVYQQSPDGESVGSASAELAPTASEEEARALIESLAYRATLVRNKSYTLNPPRKAEGEGACEADVAGIARDYIETVKAIPETATEDINSYEIFTAKKQRRFLSSTGIDVTESYPESMLEIVVNARSETHEIELYRNYPSGSCDAAALREDLERTMQYGRDRLRAQKTPNLGKVNVLFSSRAATAIYRYFADRLNTALVYRHMSDWALGEEISEDVRGDRVTLRALRTLPNSSCNRLYDAEGAPIRDVLMLENNVPRHYLGQRMFSQYLGLEDAFQPTNLEATGGTHSEEELRQGDYLEAVEFSDFHVDSLTGDIFGELRLGYWHSGGTVVPVAGGSVSGSMRDFVKELYASTPLRQYDELRIPALTLLKGVTVTGAED